jgi:hypothetical protein
MCVQLSLQDPVFSSCGYITITKSEINGSHTSPALLSEEPLCCLPELHHITVSPLLHKGCNFSAFLPKLVFFHLLSYSDHPTQCDVLTYFGLDLHYFDDQ